LRPGYTRDLRRLTVALSRARLGFYVLGRREIFESVFELQAAFEKLFARPNDLALVTGEMFPAARQLDTDVESVTMTGVEHLGQYVFEMTKAKVQMLKETGGTLPPLAEQEANGVHEDSEDDEPNNASGSEEDEED
jgi:intron-binding protein aquarius